MIVDLNMKTAKSLKEGDMLICHFNGNQATFVPINKVALLKELNSDIEHLKTLLSQLQEACLNQIEDNKKFKANINESLKKITAVLSNGKE